MKTFLKKIEAERALLRVINGHGSLPELVGTSTVAVEQWRVSVPKKLADEVVRLASMISGIAERSGERFDERHKWNSKSIQTGIDSLATKLGRQSGGGKNAEVLTR